MVLYKNPQRRDPFPPRYRTVVSTGLTGSIAAAASAVRVFCRLNCPLTPFTGGGWQNPAATLTTLNPTGYSTIANANFYQRNRVLSSRITLVLAIPDASESLAVSITPSFLTTTPSTYQAAISEQYTVRRVYNVSALSNGGRLSNKISVCTLLGVPESAIKNDLSGNYVGTYNTVCAIPCFWVVNIQPLQGTTASETSYEVLLEQDVEFYGDSVAGQPEVLAQAREETRVTSTGNNTQPTVIRL